jgi:hypothetical protein
MDPKNLKLIPQFRVEGLNINGVECTFTGGELNAVKQTVTRVYEGGGGVEFHPEGGGERGFLIYRRGETTNPIGWITPYFVPENMAVQNNPRLQKVA